MNEGGPGAARLWEEPAPTWRSRPASQCLGTASPGAPAIHVRERCLGAVIDQLAGAAGLLTGSVNRDAAGLWVDVQGCVAFPQGALSCDSIAATDLRLHLDGADQSVLGWYFRRLGNPRFDASDPAWFRTLFTAEWHVALVLDPTSLRFCFFQRAVEGAASTGCCFVPDTP